MARGNVIKSLSRGLTALDLVVEESLTPQRLAKSLDVDRTTAYRILNTLGRTRLCTSGSARRSVCSPTCAKIFSFAHTVVGKLHFPTLATPYLERLRAKTGEAASLAVLQDAVVVYVNHLCQVKKRSPWRRCWAYAGPSTSRRSARRSGRTCPRTKHGSDYSMPSTARL